MLIEHHYLDCLSQGSYLVADPRSRQAVVIDPRRDVECYLDSARARGLTIVGVLMTTRRLRTASDIPRPVATGARSRKDDGEGQPQGETCHI